ARLRGTRCGGGRREAACSWPPRAVLGLRYRLDQAAVGAGPNAQDPEALLHKVTVLEEQHVAWAGEFGHRSFRARPVEFAGVFAEAAGHADRAGARPAEFRRRVIGP